MPEKEQLIQWFLSLESSGCQLVVPGATSSTDRFGQVIHQLLTPRYAAIKCHWHINEQAFETQILQTWHPPGPVNLSFGVAEEAFFGGTGRSLIEYTPSNTNDHQLFQSYKQLIITAIQYLNPAAGLIDYEMDIICQAIENRTFMASWGNYLSAHTLEQWDANELDILRQTVDEAIWVDGRGLLAFIHPLAANQAWTSRHIEVQQLLDRNPIL